VLEGPDRQAMGGRQRPDRGARGWRMSCAFIVETGEEGVGDEWARGHCDGRRRLTLIQIQFKPFQTLTGPERTFLSSKFLK
jgi:hypothetical protein